MSYLALASRLKPPVQPNFSSPLRLRRHDDSRPPPPTFAISGLAENSPGTPSTPAMDARKNDGRRDAFALGGQNRALPYRAQMESAFGRDLGFVRVRTGAVDAMRQLGAQAAAHGHEVAFAADRPSPWLVAHELAHVIQHDHGGEDTVSRRSVAASRGDVAEREADRVADRVVIGAPAGPIGAAPRNVTHRFAETTAEMEETKANFPHVFAIPPKKRQTTQVRVAPEPHIKSIPTSPEGPWPTYEQVYAAVRDEQFDTVLDGYLIRLTLKELVGLNELCGARIEHYEQLARRQETEGRKFRLPRGEPDVMFQVAADEFKKFRHYRLAPVLAKAERRTKAASLIGPWREFIKQKFGSREIGQAALMSFDTAAKIITDESSGGEWKPHDGDVLRYGYVDRDQANRLSAVRLPEGLDRDTAPKHMNDAIIAVIKERKLLVPRKLADVLFELGDGSAADTTSLVKSLEIIDRDIIRGIQSIPGKRQGSHPFHYKAWPPNLLWDWILGRSAAKESIYNPYAKWLNTSDGMFSVNAGFVANPTQEDEAR